MTPTRTVESARTVAHCGVEVGRRGVEVGIRGGADGGIRRRGVEVGCCGVEVG